MQVKLGFQPQRNINISQTEVTVADQHLLACGCERNGKINSEAGFAHPALATGHCHDITRHNFYRFCTACLSGSRGRVSNWSGGLTGLSLFQQIHRALDECYRIRIVRHNVRVAIVHNQTQRQTPLDQGIDHTP